jgi:Protein of unknown function (DUF2855)
MAWDLLIDRADLAHAELVDAALGEPADGQVVLKVDRVGMTANNVTYAVFGDAMQYWDFFPAGERDGVAYGRVPLWGFAVVERSSVPGVEEGTRYFGYLPTSSHLVVEPTGVGPKGFRDASPHRQHLPAPYNGLTTTTGDIAYDADLEDLQILYRPLFMTSFVLADFIQDNAAFGAESVVISSASSKTSYGTAFLLDGRHRIGLTSARNRDFTEGLGCYEQVITYDEIADMQESSAVFVDVAGDATVRRAVHECLQPVHSAVVGAAHHDAAPDLCGAGDLPGAPPTFFFAPDQMRKRYDDWGPDGVEAGHAAAWKRFAPVVADWVDIAVAEGPEGLRDDWLEVLAGSTPPRTGHVIQL